MSTKLPLKGFIHTPPQDVRDAYDVLETVAKSHGSSTVSRIYAGSVSERRQEEFAKKYKVKLFHGRRCIQRLLGKQCAYGRTMGQLCDCTPPADDHPTLWGREGTPLLWVSQPYGVTLEKLQAIVAFCDHYGLTVLIDAWPSWHFPSNVVSLLYSRKGFAL